MDNNQNTLSSYYNNLGNLNENNDQSQGSADIGWSFSVVDFMATKYLTLRFGDFTTVNKDTALKTYQAVASILFICSPIVGRLSASSQQAFATYLRTWDMLITHLTYRFGDLSGIPENELVKICKAVIATERTSAPIIQNVINLYSRRNFQQQGVAQGFVSDKAA